MKEPPRPELVTSAPDELEHADEPPVVARLVVEIRSDGSRTIARGAIEDAQRGERVAIEARGDTPLHLAIALARSLTQLPQELARRAAERATSLDTGARRGGRLARFLDTGARSAVRGLLGRRRDK